MYKAPHLRTQTTRRPHDGLQATGQPRATGQVLLHSPSALRRAFHAVVNPRDPDVKIVQKLRLTAPLVVRSSRPAPLRMMCCAVP